MKPNLVVPLAPSYDQRFGGSGSVAYDQRKVNAWYEVVENPVTGKTTLMLAKRPGVGTFSTIDDYGTTTQVPYLCARWNAVASMPVLVVKDGDDTNFIYPIEAGITGSVTVLSAADYAPNYISTSTIDGVWQYLLQLRQEINGVTPHGAQRVFYTSGGPGTWSEITDGVFSDISRPKFGKMAFLDGFAFVLGSNGIYGSDLNSLSSWPESNFIAKSTEHDYPLGLIPFKDRILAFGERTCEQYFNAGNPAGSPLSRVSGGFDRVGLCTQLLHLGNTRTEYYCHLGNRVFFLGRDSHAYSQISLMSYDGGRFERVSGFHEERVMADQQVYGVFGVNLQGQSAVGILLTPPGAPKARWFMFFPDMKSWFEWESTVFTAINSGTFHCGIGNAPNILHTTAPNIWTDNNENYEFLTQFRLPFDDNEWRTMRSCGVVADIADTELDISFGLGGPDYGPARKIDLSKIKKEITRCGTFRERYVRISNVSDKPVRIRNFHASIE